jgi:RNA polymerase sigma factor (sigma-70 family)
MTLEQLIHLCKQNKADAQRQLYDLYNVRLMGVCRRYCRTREEAQDILQEAFYKVLTKISNVDSAKFESWMMKITVHTAINHYNDRMKKHNTVRLEELHSIVDNEELVIADFSNEEILSAINSLPDRARIVFNLFAVEGYSHAEIAEMLKISEGTSRSQFHYAKNLLKSKLKKTTQVRHEKYA